MSEKKYYVDFGPELLKLLGPNLYTNIYFVLGEIIANAYDADANNVYILYNTEKNSIIIEDDGTGMSYGEFNEKYLPIGITSRFNNGNTYTESGKRKRMGRKGIGKLAALSVAKRIKIISKRDGDKSGCILSLDISSKNDDGKYEIPSIDEDKIKFNYIQDIDHGSAIIMEDSRYSINKTIGSAKRNISLIFPFASEDFKIHLHNENTNETGTIDDSTKDIVKVSDTLITFCDEDNNKNKYFNDLHNEFEDDRYYYNLKAELDEKDLPPKKILNKKQPAIRTKLNLLTNKNDKKDFDMEIYGWIATYASSYDKKRDADFSANHLSIIANGKLGQFDILPEISTDRMTEAYVVGQFFVDLLEETELPDIASSNRQGYKEDDKRYIEMKKLIRKNALNPILALKKDATDEKNYLKNLEKEKALLKSKEEFDRSIKIVIDNPKFKQYIEDSEEIKSELENSWGLKDTLKEAYKKIMISHNGEDKELIDELEKVIHFCGFEKEEIIYTNSKYYESRVQPAYTDLYEYLKEFFVNTTRKTDLCVIYVLNEGFIRKWDPVLEAGAGWVLNSTWFPMFTDSFDSVLEPFPQKPATPKISKNLNDAEARLLSSAIFQAAQCCNKIEKDEDSIYNYIKTTKLYKDM